MKMPTLCKAILWFCDLLVYYDDVKRTAMAVMHDYSEGPLTRSRIRFVVLTCRQLSSKSFFGGFPQLMMLYIVFDSRSCKFMVIRSQEGALFPVGLIQTGITVGELLKGAEDSSSA